MKDVPLDGGEEDAMKDGPSGWGRRRCHGGRPPLDGGEEDAMKDVPLDEGEEDAMEDVPLWVGEKKMP